MILGTDELSPSYAQIDNPLFPWMLPRLHSFDDDDNRTIHSQNLAVDRLVPSKIEGQRSTDILTAALQGEVNRINYPHRHRLIVADSWLVFDLKCTLFSHFFKAGTGAGWLKNDGISHATILVHQGFDPDSPLDPRLFG